MLFPLAQGTTARSIPERAPCQGCGGGQKLLSGSRGRGACRAQPAAARLYQEIWSGDDPMAYAREDMVDAGYTMTNILPELIRAVLRQTTPVFWLELGSMLGGSAIRVSKEVKAMGLNTTVLCIDPWTGDVNMWEWEKMLRDDKKWRFLQLERGMPTTYERFRANVVAEEQHDVVIPIQASSFVGMKLLQKLASKGRVVGAPKVIYLDSAHEPDETLMELQLAWKLLPSGGVLLGDHWKWKSVRGDVNRFARQLQLEDTNPTLLAELAAALTSALNIKADIVTKGRVLVYRHQWVIVKK